MSNTQEKLHFVLKSTPHRVTFHQDMTDEERTVMMQHIGYWTEKQKEGFALVFGPVLKADEPHGIAIIEVDSLEQAEQLIAEDPAKMADIMVYECYPMKAVLPGK